MRHALVARHVDGDADGRGLAALVRDYLARGFFPTGTKVQANAITDPSGALVKAILIAGAADVATAAPNQSQGWGRILLDNALYFDGDASRLFLYDARNGLATGDVDVHTRDVTAGQPLTVTLTWSDLAAAVNASPALVNGLRLEVVAPNGDVWTQKLPANVGVNNAVPLQDTTTTGYDNLNNVHRIRIAAPVTGSYQVRVRSINVPQGQQKYAVAATGNFTFTIQPDFALQTSPNSRTICAGTPATYDVGVLSVAGFAAPVTLSVTGRPGASTGNFSPTPVTPSVPAANSFLSIGNTTGAANGSYNLIVRGASQTPAGNCTADTGSPAYTAGGSYKGDNLLAAFAGQELSGTWSLKLIDAANQDSGQINRWCLLPAVAEIDDDIFNDDFETPTP